MLYTNFFSHTIRADTPATSAPGETSGKFRSNTTVSAPVDRFLLITCTLSLNHVTSGGALMNDGLVLTLPGKFTSDLLFVETAPASK